MRRLVVLLVAAALGLVAPPGAFAQVTCPTSWQTPKPSEEGARCDDTYGTSLRDSPDPSPSPVLRVMSDKTADTHQDWRRW